MELPREMAFVWLPEIAARVASFLHHNVVACTLRRLNKANAETFRDFRTVQLSQPAPSEAFAEHWLSPDACKSLTLLQRRELVCLVAASGDAANLKVAIDASGCTLDVSALEAAADAGSVDCCELLLRMRPLWRGKRDSLFVRAAKGGHRPLCEWCLAQGSERRWWAVAAAYRGGLTDLAELLKPAGQPPLSSLTGLLEGVAEGCSLELLKRVWADWGEPLVLAGDEFDMYSSRALSAAVCSPTPDWEAKAEFLFARGMHIDDEHCALDALCLPGDTALPRLDWLRARGWDPAKLRCRWTPGPINFPAVRWLLAKGVPIWNLLSYWTSGCAVPLDVAQSLLAARLIEPADIVKRALQAGVQGIETLRWMFEEHGADQVLSAAWGFDGVVASGEAGCVEAMALLRSHGWAFDSRAWTHVARSGCEAALEWLEEVGCPKPADGAPYMETARRGDGRTLRVLRRLGLPWGGSSGPATAFFPETPTYGAFASAVLERVDADTLRWMVAEGCPVDWAAAKEAAEERRRDSDDPCPGEVLAWIVAEAATEPQG